MRGAPAGGIGDILPAPALSRRERIALAAFSIALGLAFAFAPSIALYGDGIAITEGLVRRRFASPHPGLFPPAALLEVSTGWRPENVLRLVSAAGGALFVAGTYLTLRRMRFSAGTAAFGAGLAGLAPASLFFARQIEVHSPHAGAVALAFAAVSAFASGRGGSAAAGLATAGVLVTHATGALSVPFLLGYGRAQGGRTWGAWCRRVLVPALLAGSAFVLAVSLLDFWFSPSPRRFRTPVHAALSLLTWASGRAEHVEGPVGYVIEALLLPSGLLAVLGIAGLLRALRRRERWALPLTLWVLVYCALGAAWQFVEEGGYLLPVYPALAVGAASLAEKGKEGSSPSPRPRGGRLLLLGALLALQGWHGIVRGVIPSLGADPFAWVEAARRETGDRGWLVSVHGVHLSLARRYTALSLATPAWLFPEPAEKREALLHGFAQPLLAGARSQTVWIDQDGPPGDDARSAWARFLELVREGATLEPATREPFRAWRVVPLR